MRNIRVFDSTALNEANRGIGKISHKRVKHGLSKTIGGVGGGGGGGGKEKKNSKNEFDIEMINRTGCRLKDIPITIMRRSRRGKAIKFKLYGILSFHPVIGVDDSSFRIQTSLRNLHSSNEREWFRAACKIGGWKLNGLEEGG